MRVEKEKDFRRSVLYKYFFFFFFFKRELFLFFSFFFSFLKKELKSTLAVVIKKTNAKTYETKKKQLT